MPFCSGLRPLRSSLRGLSQELPAAISVALDRLLSRSWLRAFWRRLSPWSARCTRRSEASEALWHSTSGAGDRRPPTAMRQTKPRLPAKFRDSWQKHAKATGRRLARRAVTGARRTFNCSRLHMTGQQLAMTSLVCQKAAPHKFPHRI